MHPSFVGLRPNRWWPRSLCVLALLLAFATLLSVRSQRARADDGCDTSEEVACIPLPAQESSGPCLSDSGQLCGQATGASAPAASVGVSVAAAPVLCPLPAESAAPATGAAAVPVPPTGCCWGPFAGESSAPSAAAVAIPPFPCPSFRDIYRTINLGNAADVRALRTLSTDGLDGYWRRGALSDIQNEIADLQLRGDYATPKLSSISIQSSRFSGLNTAIVHTVEHWRYQERSLDDRSIVFDQDEWAANEYDLTRVDGSWYISVDTITLTDGPYCDPACSN